MWVWPRQVPITHQIQDEGIEVSIDPLLSPDDYIAIKVDDYYNGLHLAKTTPKAIDFLVVVELLLPGLCSIFIRVKKW